LFISIFNSIPELISNAVQANPKFAYVLIGLAMFLENLIPPIPSEIIMPLGGYLVYQGYLNFVIVTFFGLLGTVAGAIPWYYLGKLLNEKKISQFIQKKGRFSGITKKDIEKSRFWFDKYGTSLVFWGRLVPGIRTLISIPAGIELMPLGKFLVWTSLGSLIWVILLTTAGYLLAEKYMQTYEYLDNFKIFFKPILIFIVLFFIVKLIINFKKKN
tara:strand:- start:692 stop:1336 length:645 start_codon:yes stop_codon:yes gene_type:complete